MNYNEGTFSDGRRSGREKKEQSCKAGSKENEDIGEKDGRRRAGRETKKKE